MRLLAFPSSLSEQRHLSLECSRQTFQPATARLWTLQMCNFQTLELQSKRMEPAPSHPQQAPNVTLSLVVVVHLDQVRPRRTQVHLRPGHHPLDQALLGLPHLGRPHLGLIVLLRLHPQWLLLPLLRVLHHQSPPQSLPPPQHLPLLPWPPQHLALRLQQ